MNQQPLATRRIGPPQSDFEQRIEALVAEFGLSKSALGLNAGLSKSTVANWIKKAAAGQEIGRTDELYTFARKYKRTVEWLLGETMLVEIAPEALHVDTKAMAEQAVQMLVEIDGLTRGEAAERMLGIYLNQPSVIGFYKAARLKDAPRTTDDDLDTTKKRPKK